jgi:SulP family sulfate permease
VILLVTLVGTLFNLEAGIFMGVLLSLVMFLYRTSRPEIVPVVPAAEAGAYHFVRAQGRAECPQLRIVRVRGPIYFGAASYVQQVLQQIDEDNPLQKSVLITAGGVTDIDIAGAEVLAQEARRRRRLGGGLYFYRLSNTIQKFLRQGEYVKDIGEGAFFPIRANVTGALYWTLDPDVCRTCKARIFQECKGKVLPDGFRRQRLMLATDGSEFSRAPTEIAVALAKRFGVTLDVMTSIEAESDRELAEARLAAAVHDARIAGVDCEEIVRYGKPPMREVIAAAAAADTNLLVIGRRPARGDLKEKLLGDVASQILGQAPCHVLVVGWQARMWQKRILLASDGSGISDSAAELTAQLAKATGTPVTIVAAASGDKQKAAAEEDLAQKAGLMKLDGIQAEARVLDGNAAAAIVQAARELAADLVVVGSHRPKGIAGSVAEQVIGQLQCAVLVVKPASVTGEAVADVDAKL